MARRFTYAEKGKGLVTSESSPPRLCIRAPAMDTSDLVRKNALTLIGRLTNPAEQRLRSMLPYFSNKWELRGNVTGADLGNGCFQFRFDYEEDLRKVLENRPYQYSRWMVILEKWEQIISASFLSQIPFWISLRGLPLHYWKRELLFSIGDKLGKLISFELTSTAAKIRVLLDGLKPITKEAIVEFEGGHEALVTLEYYKLDKHCLYCFRLTHEEQNCPENPKSSLNLQPPKTLEPEPPNHLKPPFFNNPRSTSSYHHQNRSGQNLEERSASRHSLRNRSPPRTSNINIEQARQPPTHTSRGPNSSPPYQRDRHDTRRHYDSGSTRNHSSRRSPEERPRRSNHSPNHPRPHQIWREKTNQRTETMEDNFTPNQRRTIPLERNLDQDDFPTPPPRRQTEAEIIQDLHDIDIRYINCGDPAESAARRQRVLESDLNGLVEETANRLYNAPSNLLHEEDVIRLASPTMTQQLNTSPQNDPLNSTSPIVEPERTLQLGQTVKKRGKPPTKHLKPNQSAARPSKHKTKVQRKSPFLRLSPLSRVIHNRANLTPQNQRTPRNRNHTETSTTPNPQPGSLPGRLPPRSHKAPARLQDGADFRTPRSPLP
ncbi:unnamed protein product [Microthlaspi erraticum]|uniref:DUF4283 domain-containing protein n=1 Tax=Microthlaspi erraticum TaxID=1685480 RepID=A0A6D2I5F1_9BRAS|nr:unnamed protein product [Microthlaspi erraticum]